MSFNQQGESISTSSYELFPRISRPKLKPPEWKANEQTRALAILLNDDLLKSAVCPSFLGGCKACVANFLSNKQSNKYRESWAVKLTRLS